ncbi:MAG: YqaA family protein [Rhizobiaceae bacterium]
MSSLTAYAGLFGIAIVAATILPAQSEAALAALLVAGSLDPVILIVVASAGNVLGSTLNYWLGRGILGFRDRRWFPAKDAAIDRAARQYRRWGRWSLLLSWVPIIGDPLTVIAGVLREPFWSFLLLVAVAKTGRYVVLAAALLNWF